ncbi:ArnT family glycosyltransferase [Alicyclobacillus contaminans]|uniref:ArnT family glycosyltransferase n=1 Tax=Alicyclobacillus contaminans TaxID=392016 RepID=UPI00041A897E|nr:glycosyltransferase family 39 protein [Alicyclobacillus contaminans]
MKRKRWQWNHTVLAIILAVSAFLNLYALQKEGYGNAYYAAAIKSMLMSWHNFFYNSFDPNGFITIDKPPVDFWIQALFAWVFGYHGWALLLPQALAGVGSVAVLYVLVRRVFGVSAGLIAAAVLALTPIAVAVQRTNEVDGLLVLVMLLTTWCFWRALETRRLRWLIYAAVLEGVGFNVKMMEAYLILPALYLVYWFATHGGWRRKLVHLGVFTVVLAAVSFSWPMAVDMTPAADRPYVGSSQTNSEMELIFGYNGLSRLTGNMGMGGGTHRFGTGTVANGANEIPGYGWPGGRGFAEGWSNGDRLGAASGNNSSGNSDSGNSAMSPGDGPWRGDGRGMMDNGYRFTGGPNGRAPQGMRGGGMFNTGQPGVLRLFQSSLRDQISWLLPMALLSLAPLLRRVRWRRKLTRKETGALYWGLWLLPMAAFYSIAGFFHQYYLITMAPGIAALTGAGLVRMWKDLRVKRRWRWYLLVVFLLNIAFELLIVQAYPSVRAPLLVGTAVAAALGILFLVSWWRSGIGSQTGIALSLAALLVGPGFWSLTPILYGVNTSMPAAGPTASQGFGGRAMSFGNNGMDGGVDSALIQYLEKHYQASPGSYLVATENANTAAPIIIETGLPVMAMGGFSGSDPALTVSELEALTKAGKLKYFLVEGMRMPGRTGQSAVMQWIQQHCKQVPESEWNPAAAASNGSTSDDSTGMSGFGRGFGGATLYEYTGD